MIIKKNFKKIWNEVKKAKNILITFHPNPDGDSIGSALALFHALQQIKKNVTLISGDSQIPSNFYSLPGIDKVTKKNFFNIDISQYDLFIINDIASLNQITKLDDPVFPKNLKTINIDHHVSNQGIGNINLIDGTYPSTCQIIYDLFQTVGIKLTPNIAASLFIGIYTDTGGFKYLGTTEKTFQAAAKLAKIYPQFTKLIFDIENNDHPDRLKFLSLILNSVETFYSDNVVIATLTHQSIKDNNLSPFVISSSDTANILKSITGWQIGVAIIEPQPNQIKSSFRTRDASKFDLSKIATILGGGGHKAAAGFSLKDTTVDQAKKQILKAIKTTYPKIDHTDIKT